MKITDLIGRLAPKYPGLYTKHVPDADGYVLYAPYQFSVGVTENELSEAPDDVLVIAIERRIEEVVRCANA